MPSNVEVLSAAAAVGSFLAAAWVALFARRQVKSAEEQALAAKKQVDIANESSRQAIRGAQIQLVIHFADSYHAIRNRGVEFAHEKGCDEFWGLYYLEFFYFNQADIPASIFGLWMVELADLYCREAEAWGSHERHLLRFSVSFPRMYQFFRGIHEITQRDRNAVAIREQAILDYVDGWAASGAVR